jgi:hypothetical protein
MSEPRRDEKYQDEKGRGEKDEKGRDESWDEKWRRDPVEAALWAFVLIWFGLAWLASNIGIFGDGLDWWAFGFLGAGLIIFLGVAARLLVPAYRRPVTGSIILGLIFIGIGLGNLIEKGWEVIGPLVLIGIGIAGLAAFFLRGREE